MPPASSVDPAPVVGDRQHDLAVPLRELDPDGVAAVLERVLEQLAEDERERGRAPARERHVRERGLDVLLRAQPLDEHRAQPVEQLVEIDLLVAPLASSTSCTAAIARIRLTESSSAFLGSISSERA